MAMMVVRWATIIRLSGYGRKAFGATVVRPSGGLRGFVRLNFRVAISGVSNLGY